MDKVKLGKKIKLARIEADLTQQEFCKQLGTSAQTVVSWEKGVFLPKSEMMRKIAQVLNRPLEYFYADSEEESQTFEKILKLWNGNNFRGAQARLCRELPAEAQNINNWLKGRQTPSEVAFKKMSLLFSKSKEIKEAGIDVSIPALKKMFGIPEIKQRVGFDLIPRNQWGEETITLSAVYHAGDVIFMDDNMAQPSKEKPMIAEIRVTEEKYAPLFAVNDKLIVDSRGQAEEGKICLYKVGARRALGKLTRGTIVDLADKNIRHALSDVQLLGVVTEKRTRM